MNISCEICLELLIVTDDLRVTSCGHLFHMSCLTQWFQRGQLSCPHCRQSNTDTLLRQVFLTSVSENDVHLSKNCKAEEIKDNLKVTQDYLDSLKIDYDNVSHENQELKLKLVSMEESHKIEMDETKNGIIKLESQLSQAIYENNVKTKDLEENKAKLISLEEFLNNTKSQDVNNLTRINTLTLICKKQEAELEISNIEIKKLKFIQDALISQSSTNKEMKPNLGKEDETSSGVSVDNYFRRKGKFKENRITSKSTAQSQNKGYNRIDTDLSNLLYKEETLMGALTVQFGTAQCNEMIMQMLTVSK